MSCERSGIRVDLFIVLLFAESIWYNRVWVPFGLVRSPASSFHFVTSLSCLNLQFSLCVQVSLSVSYKEIFFFVWFIRGNNKVISLLRHISYGCTLNTHCTLYLLFQDPAFLQNLILARFTPRGIIIRICKCAPLCSLTRICKNWRKWQICLFFCWAGFAY